MPNKIWYSFNFLIEVAIESPGDADEAEAAEDAADFMVSVGHVAGKVGDSYASVVRIDEAGRLRPANCPVIFRAATLPSGKQVSLTLPRGVERKQDFEGKRKPVKARKPIKKKRRL